jgi:hypothetical protein
MSTLECGYCGEQITVDSLDDPPELVQLPASGRTPRRFAVFGGRSHWLIHRCDISQQTEIDLRDTPASDPNTVDTSAPA